MLLGDDDDLTKAEEGLSIAPLIDCVFLLLIYFITSTSLRQLEADLGIRLPGSVQMSKSVEMPDEQIVEISADGRIVLNNTTYGTTPDVHELPDLETTLLRYRESCRLANNKDLITIMADGATRHQRVIDVMNACAAAGCTNVTIGGGGE